MSVTNIRDIEHQAHVLPQYNALNFGYRMYVQVTQRIRDGELPEHLIPYLEQNNITIADMLEQTLLLSDLYDAMASGKVERKYYETEDGKKIQEPYHLTCMDFVQWGARVNWKILIAVHDMIACSFMATWLLEFSTRCSAHDIELQQFGDMRSIIDEVMRKASDPENPIYKLS
jgi:hypothetical protein